MLESALKHGLTKEQVVHAWEHVIERAVCYQLDNGGFLYKAIGFDEDGRAIELAASEKNDIVSIFHANTKLTARIFRELSIERRENGKRKQGEQREGRDQGCHE